MESITRQLAEFTAKLKFDDLPEEVVQETKREILDIIGCALGGYLSEIGRITISFVRELGGNPESTIIGSGDKTSVLNAAYANSRMGNALDADDTFLRHGHFAQSAVASALALCERAGYSGKELMTSVAAGFEVGARIGLAAGPVTSHMGNETTVSRSFGIGTSMVTAAAGAAAKALNLNAEQAYHTLCMAGAFIPLPLMSKHMENPGSLPLFKYGDAGWCAESGIAAAMLAEKGSTGLPDVFDGRDGAFVALGVPFEECDFKVVVEGLGEKWYLPETSYKAWPSCRVTHQPLTAFTTIIEQNQLRVEELEKVIVRGDEVVMEPRFRQQNPEGMISCEFSIPHAIAMVALDVAPALWYTVPVMSDPKVQEVRRRVFVESQPKIERKAAALGAAALFSDTSVEVKARGCTFRETALYAKGDPADKRTYFTDSELKDKFMKFGIAVHESLAWKDQLERIVETVYNVEKLDSVGKLMSLVSPSASY